jgi:holdfast attachment protein HfaA
MGYKRLVSRALAGVFGAGLVCAATAAAAGNYDQASAYGGVGIGMAPGEENAAISGSTRDANGNRVFINGLEQGVAYPVTDNANTLGVGSAGTLGGPSATAIGNALNVTVNGAWNTVIVNSKQVNNGNQSATLNGQIHF